MGDTIVIQDCTVSEDAFYKPHDHVCVRHYSTSANTRTDEGKKTTTTITIVRMTDDIWESRLNMRIICGIMYSHNLTYRPWCHNIDISKLI